MQVGRKLASRLIRSSRQQAFRSAVLVITLSVAPLVVIVSLSQAMIEGIVARFIETYSYHLQLSHIIERPTANTIAKIRQSPGVVQVHQELRSYALLFTSAGRMSVEVRGIDKGLQQDAGFLRYAHLSPSDASLQEAQIWLGAESAKRLGLEVGDNARLLLVAEDAAGEYRPRIIRAKVSAIVTTGYQSLDESWVFIDLEWAKELFGQWQGQLVTGIKLQEPYRDIGRQQAQLQQAVGDMYLVYDWQTINQNELISMNSSRGILIFLLMIIMVVAIANTLGVLQLFYLEQIQTIAALTFLGMNHKNLFIFYLWVALWAALWGGGFGVVLGVVLVWLFTVSLPLLETLSGQLAQVLAAFFPQLSWHGLDLSFYLKGFEVRLNWAVLMMIWLGVVALMVLMSIVPAWRTSRLKPMAILRKI